MMIEALEDFVKKFSLEFNLKATAKAFENFPSFHFKRKKNVQVEKWNLSKIYLLAASVDSNWDVFFLLWAFFQWKSSYVVALQLSLTSCYETNKNFHFCKITKTAFLDLSLISLRSFKDSSFFILLFLRSRLWWNSKALNYVHSFIDHKSKIFHFFFLQMKMNKLNIHNFTVCFIT